MDKTPYILVSISIFTHAYWNLLIKRSENKHIFTALSKLVEVVIFGLPAMYYLIITDFKGYFLWSIAIASILTFLNYFFLSNAYKYGEFSLVYPVSRSSVLFLPILAYFFIGESIDVLGAIAIVLILIGTLTLNLDSLDKKGFRSLFSKISNKGSVYSLLAALTVAGYTLWDKISISRMEPFLYFYLYTLVIACFYNMFIYFKFSNKEIRHEWNKNKMGIVQVGFLNSFTYILILIALTMGKATYIGGLRQLSIVVGIFLGQKFLNENLGIPKIVGLTVSILGASLIFLAK